MQPSIVFIHGMFMTPKSWASWQAYFEARGYTTHAPAWPYHEGEPAKLRNQPAAELSKLTLGQLVNHYAAFIDTLDTEPILIGHSMGGLIVQKLLAMNKGQRGICIDSAAPKGVTAISWSFLKSNFPVINPFAGDSLFLHTKEQFQYAFCNTMTQAESDAFYDALAVPESRNVARSSTGSDGAIDFAKPHRPLLFIAGEQDHIIPAALNRKNHAAYTDPNSKRDLREFAGRTHIICAQPGWEEVAAHVAKWLS